MKALKWIGITLLIAGGGYLIYRSLKGSKNDKFKKEKDHETLPANQVNKSGGTKSGKSSDDSFPIKAGHPFSDLVVALQVALGAGLSQDGKFGSKTSAELKKQTGYTSIASKSEYDKIMASLKQKVDNSNVAALIAKNTSIKNANQNGGKVYINQNATFNQSIQDSSGSWIVKNSDKKLRKGVYDNGSGDGSLMIDSIASDGWFVLRYFVSGNRLLGQVHPDSVAVVSANTPSDYGAGDEKGYWSGDKGIN